MKDTLETQVYVMLCQYMTHLGIYITDASSGCWHVDGTISLLPNIESIC